MYVCLQHQTNFGFIEIYNPHFLDGFFFGGFVVFCVRLAEVTVCDQRAG
jgi:hypothetical protein